MKKKLIQLRETRAKKWEEFEQLSEDLEKSEEAFTDEQRTKFDDLDGEIKQLDSDIERYEAMEKRNKEIAAKKQDIPADMSLGDSEQKEKRQYNLGKVVRSLMNKQPLDGFEKEMHQEVMKRNADRNITQDGLGFAVPAEVLGQRERGYTVGEDSGTKGGKTVATDQGALVEFMKPHLVLDKLGATGYRDLRGDFDLPRETDEPGAAWEGEIDAAADKSGVIDKITMTPKRLAAYIPYSYKMLAQSELAVEQYTEQRLREGISNALNDAFINGTGSGDQPEGILTTVIAYNSGGQVISIGTNGGALTWPKIVELESKLTALNVKDDSLKYLSNSKVLGALKTITKDSGSGMFIFNELAASAPVNGRPLVISNYVKSNGTKGTGTNLSTIAMGDWSKAAYGQWGDIYIDLESNAKAGQKELIVNSFWDVACLRETAFAVITDATT